MLRVLIIGALAGLIGSLIVIGVSRLIGAIAGAVAASAVIGSIRRDTTEPAPEAPDRQHG